jgi:signal transduction histidine kinase
MRKYVPHIAGVLAIAGGSSNIIGWLIGSDFLKDPFHTNFMAPNTALCLIVTGVALFIQQQNLSRWFWAIPNTLLALFVALAGFLTSCEYVFRADLRIDRLFLASKLGDWTAPNVLPGRIAPNASLAIFCIGMALLFPVTRLGRFKLADIFILPIVLISFLGVVGYSYHTEPLYGLGEYSSMSLQTTILLGVVAIGLLWTRSELGVMALVLSDDAGGVAARRLLIATFIVFPVLGWARVRAQDMGLMGSKSGTALLVIVSVLVFSFMIMRTSHVLRELDIKRRQAEESLLRSHAELESLVEQRTRALRYLSMRLMRLQDEERRKIARELHDGLGQYLAALNINLDRMAQTPESREAILNESREILTKTMSEVRTLSHLLHPPLLDEMGFATAAKWFVEGFAKRSGVKVELNLQEDLPRLPDAIEIGLFRVLQEGLTNIHRHSGSAKAEIGLNLEKDMLSLLVRDYGKGIPVAVLEKWQSTGAAGIGLTGMQERIKELGGQVEINNTGNGTEVSVKVPVSMNVVQPTGAQAIA